ncbi:MAG: hypothetical protein EHM64_16790 [Ignavibacteriae bacterium]|nr:MAG: hypothetical protein EHM64_16790 [Ignavibacteriota bacterium]
MKLINAVSIWDNGQVKEAKILNAYAVNVTLGTSATFYYQLFSENVDLSVGQQLAQGNLNMTGEAYAQWEVDAYAWDWVASELNLTITGDYVPPVPPTTEPTPEPKTTTEETTETEPTPETETEG